MAPTERELTTHATAMFRTPYVYGLGELWIVLGIDGVPLWKPHVVGGTLALTGTLKSLEAHSLARVVEDSGCVQGVEENCSQHFLVVNVKAVFDALHMDNVLHESNGTILEILGHGQH